MWHSPSTEYMGNQDLCMLRLNGRDIFVQEIMK